MTYIGEIKLVKQERISGDLAASTSGPMEVGGARNPKVCKMPLELPLPERAKLRSAILDMYVTAFERPERVRWKVWLDGFPLAREFKPQVMCQLEEKYHCKLLFDVTPIVRTSKDTHNLVVHYEGSREIRIDHATLIGFYECDDAELSYAYLAGTLMLEPGDEYVRHVALPELPDGEGELRVVSIVPSRSAKVTVELNDAIVTRIQGDMGVAELTVRPVELRAENRLRVTHHNAQTPYYPKHLALSSIILSSSKVCRPVIVMEGCEVVDEGVRVKLRNRGLTKPDKLIVIAMRRGMPVFREVVAPLSPGEEAAILIPHEHSGLTVRVIWTRLGRRWMISEAIDLSRESKES